MDLYLQYCALPIDHGQVGLLPGERESSYFCTPLGADILGWAGVDGIHFCRIEGFGERVFSVSPMNLAGEYVWPVAATFEDFLRLILACRGTAAIEQMFAWSRGDFENFLSCDIPELSRQVALAAISDAFSLEAMEDPYGYVKKLQRDTDLSGLRFSEDYDEWAPPVTKPQHWKVSFEGSFDRRVGHGGKEIPVNKSFQWGDNLWYVPAVYACAEGLVVDMLVRGDKERVSAYINKVSRMENGGMASVEDMEALERENPMEHDFSITALLNSNVMTITSREGRYYLPQDILPEDVCCDASAKMVVSHYGMDTHLPWALYRAKFSWNSGKKPPVRSLSLTYVSGKRIIPGPLFETGTGNTEMEFVHPVTGISHRICAMEMERMDMDIPRNILPGAELPGCCWRMCYSIDPDIPAGDIQLRDTAPGEEPRYTADSVRGVSQAEAAAIGIIGGADGPTSVFIASPGRKKGRWVNSSMRFTHPEKVKWRLEFLDKPLGDFVLKIK